MQREVATPPDVDPGRLLDLPGTLLAVVGFDAVVRWTSASFPRKLGLSPAALVGRSFLDFVHPDDLEVTRRELERLRRGEDVVGFEWRMGAADGSYRSMRWSAAGVLEEELIYGSAQDLTDLHAAEERFAAAFDHAALPSLLTSGREADFGRIVAANPAAARFIGLTEDGILRRHVQSLMHEDDLDRIETEARRLVAGEVESFTLEARYRHADCGVRWGQQSVSLIRDAAGQP